MVIEFPAGHRMTRNMLYHGLCVLTGDYKPVRRSDSRTLANTTWGMCSSVGYVLTFMYTHSDGRITIRVHESLHDTLGTVIRAWLADTSMIRALDKAKEKHEQRQQ